MTEPRNAFERNAQWFDAWSIVHFGSAAALTFLLGPLWAAAIVILWEPLELFVLSPLATRFGMSFGREAWPNVVGDLISDGLGVGAALLIL